MSAIVGKADIGKISWSYCLPKAMKQFIKEHKGDESSKILLFCL